MTDLVACRSYAVVRANSWTDSGPRVAQLAEDAPHIVDLVWIALDPPALELAPTENIDGHEALPDILIHREGVLEMGDDRLGASQRGAACADVTGTHGVGDRLERATGSVVEGNDEALLRSRERSVLARGVW